MAEVASGSHSATPCFDADFYPFGGEHDFTNTCAQNYKFMGKERDPETNNDNFGARSYASAYGRFLSADWSSTPSPVPYANLTNPQTLNLYAMVSDNPESFADLDGHMVQLAQAAAGYCTDSALGSCSVQTSSQTTTSTPEYTPYGQSFNGYGAASVSVTQTTTTTTTTQNADGSTTQSQTVTTSQTTAYYSLKDGSYQGATQSTTVTKDGNTDHSGDKPAAVSMDAARRAIGSDAMNRASQIAQPGFATGFAQATQQDYHAYPAKYWGAGLSIAVAVIDPPATVGAAGRALAPLVLNAWDAMKP